MIRSELAPVSVVITASDVEEVLSFDQLVQIVQKHSLIDWLSLLSRAQTILLSQKLSKEEQQAELLVKLFSRKLKEKIFLFGKKSSQEVRTVVITADTLGVLQQLAILHCSQDEGKPFETDEDYQDLGKALLNVSEIIHGEDFKETTAESIISLIRQQIRIDEDDWWRTFTRSFLQFGFDGNPTDSAKKLLDEFEAVTNVNAQDYFVGASCLLFPEISKTVTELQSGWSGISQANIKAEKLISSYKSLHCCSPNQLKLEISTNEPKDIRQWTLVPLRRFPLIQIGPTSVFVLSPGAVAESLLHGIFHHIRTSLLKNAGQDEPKKTKDMQRIGNLYGELFENFVAEQLQKTFGERLKKLPISDIKGRKRCDFILQENNKLILIEVKSRRRSPREFHSCSSPDEFIKFVQNLQAPDAIAQISDTIDDLRKRIIVDLGLTDVDWTTMAIVPLVICEDVPPAAPFAWHYLYSQFDAPLEKHRNGLGKVGHFRCISAEDIFYIENFIGTHEFSSLLFRWGEDESLRDHNFQNFLITIGITLQSKSSKRYFKKAVDLLASEIGLGKLAPYPGDL